MSARRRKHDPAFKAKVALAAFAQLIARTEMISEHSGCRLHQRLLPRVDLMGMDPEVSGELGYRGFLAQCRERNLGLESGIVLASTCRHFLPPCPPLGRTSIMGQNVP